MDAALASTAPRRYTRIGNVGNGGPASLSQGWPGSHARDLAAQRGAVEACAFLSGLRPPLLAVVWLGWARRGDRINAGDLIDELGSAIDWRAACGALHPKRIGAAMAQAYGLLPRWAGLSGE